jgi:coproporphyrinogen III oxidase
LEKIRCERFWTSFSGRSINMSIKSHLPYPKEEYVEFLKDFYTDINGAESFEPVKEWHKDKWSASVNCSRGKVLEKAGFARVHVVGGTINENPGDISLFETLAYPVNPKIPGFIIMTNMNKTESTGKILVFYTDIIIQDGKPHDEEKKLFSATVKNICEKHGHNPEEHKALLTGRGLLGGNAGECGLLNFFEEKDMPLLENLIKGVLPAYKEILEISKNEQPKEEDYENMNRSRARLIEWIIVEDYGIKIARENGIPLNVIEAYGFPPVVRY